MVDVVILIGRVLYAVVFIGGAFGHFANSAAVAQHATSKGLRPARLFVLGSGVYLMIAGLMLVLGIWIDVAALMILAFLIPATAVMHRFWSADAETALNEQIHFNKNIALAGAALMLFGFAVKAGPTLGYTLTGPLLG